MKIEPVFLSIGGLFNNVPFFQVPKYQRNYAWEEDQIKQFISDLSDCFSARLKNTPISHFFGGIVSIDQKIQGSYKLQCEVIDGQQRLATFVILMSVLLLQYEQLKQQAIKSNQNQIQAIIEKRLSELKQNYIESEFEINRNIEKKKRLVLSSPDKDFFDALILNFSPRPTRESHERLLFAFDEISKFISSKVDIADLNKSLDNLKQIEEILNDDMTIIHLTTETKSDAYKLFQVLNNRGINLTEGDLLRARSLEVLETEQFTHYQRQVEKDWDDILKDKPEQTKDFLNWYFSSVKGVRPKQSNLFDDFVDKILIPKSITLVNEKVTSDNDAKEVQTNIKVINDEILKLRLLVDGIWPYEESHQTISNWHRERLRILICELKHTHCIPLLLSASVIFTDDRDFFEVVDIVERFIFRYKIISNQHITSASDIYLRHAVNIRNSNFKIKEMKSELNDLIKTKAPNDVFTVNLKQEIKYKPKSGNKTLKYFLITLEYFHAWYTNGATGQPTPKDTSIVFDFNNTTIEHIYPQKSAIINSDLELVKNNIGNLSVLGPSDNKKLGNKNFQEKKSNYLSSSVSLNRVIGALNDWDLTSVNNWETKLINMSIEIFKI